MEKKIIGYKLKDAYLHLKEVAADIGNYNRGYDVQKFLLTEEDKTAYNGIQALKKAGVLDLWFEPVYKDEYKIGDWVVVKSINQGGSGNGIYEDNLVSQLYKKDYNNASGKLSEHADFSVKEQRAYYNIIKDHIIRKATPEEVKKALIEEAIKRGFKEGVIFEYKEQSRGESTLKGKINSGLEVEYFKEHNLGWRILSRGQGVIYSDKWGWAEILPSYPQITINSYKGEFFDWGVKFGCAEINKGTFIELKDLCGEHTHQNREIESVTIGKGTFTKDQIKLIAEYYLNK
ncbi:MAG: hypothetical protein EHM93_19765 [Bacteroidales bacterium]|nr:MAG: hypothetical protein EHM93_19765 [Bacteroidales bacterium]